MFLSIKIKRILGTILTISGILFLLKVFGVLELESENIFATSLIAFGILTINYAFKNDNKNEIILATISFMLGVIFIIHQRFEILDFRGITLVTILFIAGATSIMLFVNDRSEKQFLYAGTLLIILSYLSISFFRDLGLYILANKIANLAEVFWPVILMILGILIFVNRKK